MTGSLTSYITSLACLCLSSPICKMGVITSFFPGDFLEHEQSSYIQNSSNSVRHTVSCSAVPGMQSLLTNSLWRTNWLLGTPHVLPLLPIAGLEQDLECWYALASTGLCGLPEGQQIGDRRATIREKLVPPGGSQRCLRGPPATPHFSMKQFTTNICQPPRQTKRVGEE